MISIEKLSQISSHLTPVVGSFGGRKFQYEDRLFTMKELFKTLHHYRSADIDQAPSIHKIWSQLKNHDLKGEKLLLKSTIFVKLLTKVRRFFGNFSGDWRELIDSTFQSYQPALNESEKRARLIQAIQEMGLNSFFNATEIGKTAWKMKSSFEAENRYKSTCCSFFTDTNGEAYIVFKKKHVKALIGKGGQSIVIHALSIKTLERKAFYRTFLTDDNSIKHDEDEKIALKRLTGIKGVLTFQMYSYYRRKNTLKRINISPFYPAGDLYEALVAKTLSRKNKQNIMVALIHTVKQMHKQNVMHRDIKLDNILLIDRDTPILADLGMLSVCEPASKTYTFCCGSPLYASPEILFTCERGLKTDVWSLGVTLFALFMEENPYSDKNGLPTKESMKRAASRLDLSDPYHKVISQMLTYDHKLRPRLDQINIFYPL